MDEILCRAAGLPTILPGHQLTFFKQCHACQLLERLPSSLGAGRLPYLQPLHSHHCEPAVQAGGCRPAADEGQGLLRRARVRRQPFWGGSGAGEQGIRKDFTADHQKKWSAVLIYRARHLASAE